MLARIVLEPGQPVHLILRWRSQTLVDRWIRPSLTFRALCENLLRDVALNAHRAMGRLDPPVVPDDPPRGDVPAPPMESYFALPLSIYPTVVGVHEVAAYGASLAVNVFSVQRGFVCGGSIDLFAGATRVGTETLLYRFGPDVGGAVGRVSFSIGMRLGDFARRNAYGYRSESFTFGGEAAVSVDLLTWRRRSGGLFAGVRGGAHVAQTLDGWQRLWDFGLGVGVRP